MQQLECRLSLLDPQVSRREKAIQKLELDLLTAQENHRRTLDDVRIHARVMRRGARTGFDVELFTSPHYFCSR